ncbi:hypothetical protein [Brevibacillus parabrevis]|uniref:hypothetical protein n=1 Tax=Brevibacillus parabrevis TaxID=54914 RepID=UPI000B21AC8F|nr:hypothetical protein [Brevibacillus parabrevis]
MENSIRRFGEKGSGDWIKGVLLVAKSAYSSELPLDVFNSTMDLRKFGCFTTFGLLVMRFNLIEDCNNEFPSVNSKSPLSCCLERASAKCWLVFTTVFVASNLGVTVYPMSWILICIKPTSSPTAFVTAMHNTSWSMLNRHFLTSRNSFLNISTYIPIIANKPKQNKRFYQKMLAWMNVPVPRRTLHLAILAPRQPAQRFPA